VAAGQAARSGGEYFAAPEPGPQRRYEALRAYLLDGEPAATVAQRFGYTTTGHADFRAAIQPSSRRVVSDGSGVLVAQGAAVEPGGGEGLGQVGLAQDG
jgi:hypothetical protein